MNQLVEARVREPASGNGGGGALEDPVAIASVAVDADLPAAERGELSEVGEVDGLNKKMQRGSTASRVTAEIAKVSFCEGGRERDELLAAVPGGSKLDDLRAPHAARFPLDAKKAEVATGLAGRRSWNSAASTRTRRWRDTKSNSAPSRPNRSQGGNSKLHKAVSRRDRRAQEDRSGSPRPSARRCSSPSSASSPSWCS